MADTRQQAKKDAQGFDVTVKDITTGTVKPYDEGGTTEVGCPYDLDPMGYSKKPHKPGVK